MDKRESENTITIKINGKKQDFEITRQTPQSKPLIIQKKNDAIIFPIQEQEEFTSQAEAAAAKAEQEESFDWILPEPSEHVDVKEFTYSEDKPIKKKSTPFGKRQSSFFKTIFTAVLLAIVIGTGFGFIMLKLVLPESAVETVKEQVLGDEPSSKENQPRENNQKGNISLVTAKISTFIIQAGAFSSTEAAQKELQTVKSKGAPTQILSLDERALLLVGVADSKEHADGLEANLKESGTVNVFDKRLEVGGKDLRELHQSEKELLEALPLLFQSLSSASANASVNSSIPKATLESIDEQMKIIAGIDDKQFTNDAIKTLKKNTDNALKQVKSIKNKDKITKDESTAFQQHLLAILASYHSL